MQERVTIHDIARESGVSVSTVSLVMNNRPGVAQETRLRVLETAGSLGYTSKTNLQNAKGNRLNTVGVVVKQESNTPPFANPFYSKVLAGIEEACRLNGTRMLFTILPVDENNRCIDLQPVFFKADVDGLLMVGTFVDSTISQLNRSKLPPVVLVDGYSDTESYDTVISDNFRAAYQAVENLIEKGHRHIGLIGGQEESYPSLRDRRNGYLRALKDHRISNTYCAEFNINCFHGYEETQQLLARNPQITGLFAVNDETALNAMRAVQDMGKRVPQDVSVVGFDDTYLAVNANPSLTTMRVDTTAMGYAAIQMLALRCLKPGLARMTLTIHLELIERDSVCALPIKD